MVVDPNQVVGLTATQNEGFATLAWEPVAGATDYQIERTPVDAANVPTGASVIVGVWQPIRTVTPGSPRFAEAGFALGGRYQWRVRARFGTTSTQAYSEPVFGTTRPQWGTGPGAGLRTGWETSGNATYTTHARRSRTPRRSTRPATASASSSSAARTRRVGRRRSRQLPDQHVHPRLPEPAGDRRGDLEPADDPLQLQRPRQRAAGPRVVLHLRAHALVHGGPAPARDPLERDGADRPDDQRQRPRRQRPRQRDGRRPEPRPRAAPPAGDARVREGCSATTRPTWRSTCTRATARTCRSSRRGT